MFPQQPFTPSIKWHEVTWYSKLGAALLLLVVVPALSFYIGIQYESLRQMDVNSMVANSQIVPGVIDSGRVTSVATTSANMVLLRAAPASGRAPLIVYYFPANMGLGDHWIEFGDGARTNVECELYQPDTDACLRMKYYMHTYSKAGTYTAEYKEHNITDNVVGSAIITVAVAPTTTGQTSNAAPFHSYNSYSLSVPAEFNNGVPIEVAVTRGSIPIGKMSSFTTEQKARQAFWIGLIDRAKKVVTCASTDADSQCEMKVIEEKCGEPVRVKIGSNLKALSQIQEAFRIEGNVPGFFEC